MSKFSHLDEEGRAKMVDVGAKEITRRTATARTIVKLPAEVAEALQNGDIVTKKGSVFSVARIAGIMAVKKTSDLIPLCHPLSINGCKISIEPLPDQHDAIEIRCTVEIDGKTGVEMEALTGSSVTALTIYDMCKALSHDIVISETRLLNKSGGKRDFKYQN